MLKGFMRTKKVARRLQRKPQYRSITIVTLLYLVNEFNIKYPND